ncbi:MAG: hypothetical protein NTV14_04065 [Coprothermobacterota bacterium]|nr:hypothetical protein [Coprothermobacterota bacterium]
MAKGYFAQGFVRGRGWDGLVSIMVMGESAEEASNRLEEEIQARGDILDGDISINEEEEEDEDSEEDEESTEGEAGTS